MSIIGNPIIVGSGESPGSHTVEFPSDWFVDAWTQDVDTQSKTWTHGLGQVPRFVLCVCLDDEYGGNGRIMDTNILNTSGSGWYLSTVYSVNSTQTTLYGTSGSVGYNNYDINDTTITLTQGRYYSATFKAGKRYLLLAHK